LVQCPILSSFVHGRTTESLVKNELSKEELLQMLMRLLRADDLSFLLQLQKEDIERLVAVIRNRIND
jgi:hypothetical protein